MEAGIRSKSVLIVEDEQSIRDSLLELFEVDGVVARAVESLEEARIALSRNDFDFIITDIRLGGDRDGGLQVMALSGFLAPDTPVVVLTAYPDAENRHASSRLGATYFMEKPASLDRIAALAYQHGVCSAMSVGDNPGSSTSLPDHSPA